MSNEFETKLRLDRTEKALALVLAEVTKATNLYGPFNSTHEGYGVLAEEVDELWDDIKANRTQHAAVEAVQVAAMAVRFVVDCPKWMEDESEPVPPVDPFAEAVLARDSALESGERSAWRESLAKLSKFINENK
ncbi:MAG: hypothetical protein EOP83_13005 [Verrucomicrobiaceae bacterium]|nr:MAG: hypothetical protein EOP83_13005 [Verrucomicrobiaceae bacterium]